MRAVPRSFTASASKLRNHASDNFSRARDVPNRSMSFAQLLPLRMYPGRDSYLQKVLMVVRRLPQEKREYEVLYFLGGRQARDGLDNSSRG